MSPQVPYSTCAIPERYASLDGMESDFLMPSEQERTAQKVYCSNIQVKSDEFGGDGAYALKDFKKGECVEWGIMRRIPLDGNQCEYVFTWSEDRTVWAMGSGASVYYNTHPERPNTEMIRYFGEDRFEIYAIHDIKAGEQLTHTYRSLKWRKCFQDLPQKGA